MADEMALLREQLLEADESLRKSKAAQLELVREQRRLAREKDEMALTIEKTLAEERNQVRSQLATQIAEEFQQKDLQKDKQIADMLKQLHEMKRRAEQGSQQLQGEVRELDLEETLSSAFPQDTLEPVPKGIKGADLVQKVRSSLGKECGTIVWETKQTKAWSDSWLQKLRDDTRAMNGDVAILLTAVLPAGETEFCARDNVWIANPKLAICIATVVRAGLESVVKASVAAEGRVEKADYVYAFITSSTFRGQVETLVEAWRGMHDDLASEKRALTRAWAKRERQLERALLGTAQLYGSIQGIVGSSLPEIEALSISSLDGENLLSAPEQEG